MYETLENDASEFIKEENVSLVFIILPFIHLQQKTLFRFFKFFLVPTAESYSSHFRAKLDFNVFY